MFYYSHIEKRKSFSETFSWFLIQKIEFENWKKPYFHGSVLYNFVKYGKISWFPWMWLSNFWAPPLEMFSPELLYCGHPIMHAPANKHFPRTLYVYMNFLHHALTLMIMSPWSWGFQWHLQWLIIFLHKSKHCIGTFW